MKWLAGAMHASRARLDVATNNIANVSSDGFNKTYARTIARSNSIDVLTATDRSQGPLVRTGQRFDLALLGPGTFTVRGADGQTDHIRTGRFVRDAHGRLCDDRGRNVLDRAGAPIMLSAVATVDENGAIREGTRTVGRIALPHGTTVHSGFLERPSVDAIAEMVAVLDAQRSFETAQKVMMTLDEARNKAANEIGRLKQ